MKVPVSWLREFVAIDMPIPDLARRLTMAGLEVEDVHRVGSEWRNIAIARVEDLERHPRSDTLWVARLETGGPPATVVTAAQNLQVGAVVPHIRVGGELAKGEVGLRTFMGITSEGMLCSGEELGISTDKDGIYLMESEATIGEMLSDYLTETVLDLYITANRPDCMSVVGIAREVHALTGAEFRRPGFAPPRGSRPASSLVAVEIEDPVGCPRFTAGAVTGVRVRPSPLPIQRRLFFSGVRPISNVVDVTNYVMLELGQPLHAFDRSLVSGQRLIARRARPGETMRTLDGVERNLAPDMMVVADSERARALAGIMGGEDSEIRESTTEVLLEGAHWDRASVRMTSGALNLSSEASRRFGRGVDPELTTAAVSRAVQMTVELAGGEAAEGLVDVYPGRHEQRVINTSPELIHALLGAEYPRQQIVSILTSLDFGVEESGEHLAVTVPSHRQFDVEHRADLAEEVARVAGYERIPTTLPTGQLPADRPDGDAGFSAGLRLRQLLVGAGLQEVITYSLVDPGQPARLEPDGQPREKLIPIANPMSPEHSVLRASLVGSLLETVSANMRHHDRVALFELARTWQGSLDPLPDERRRVGVVLRGPREPRLWSGAGPDFDFFDLKGMVDLVARAFNVQPKYTASADLPGYLHPGRSARISLADQPLGVLGQLHPSIAERLELGDTPVLVAELDFELLNAPREALAAVVTPSRYPPSDRDVSLVVDQHVPQGEVEQVIREAAGPLLSTIRLFDVYQGDQVAAGRKSLAYALRYQASDRTLSEAEVSAAHEQVESALAQRLTAEIRGRG